MQSLKIRLAALRGESANDSASLSAKNTAAPTEKTTEFKIVIERDLPAYKGFVVMFFGGFMLQNGELLPLNFEYLGREKAQDFFKNFGALFDARSKSAYFFLGDSWYCELNQQQFFNPTYAEYVKFFVDKVKELKEKISSGVNPAHIEYTKYSVG